MGFGVQIVFQYHMQNFVFLLEEKKWNRFKLLFYGKFGVFRLDFARKKLAKGYCVAKKVRDKKPLLEILVGIHWKLSPRWKEYYDTLYKI